MCVVFSRFYCVILFRIRFLLPQTGRVVGIKRPREEEEVQDVAVDEQDEMEEAEQEEVNIEKMLDEAEAVEVRTLI